ncbi:AraC family transcriptional regulator [Stigmatella erecta]|uniref:Transcriptional regulator, AraC family n=1 Tax=Stigmatella erecta TaxID=83460 RepID=A0A1I0K3C7_9BACT|nr:helix-turn-helix transcriptional regulator [Stigmatella erecta]SEU18032.1 transcriptional regulator, AraC family [Stigmatella erecta]
MPILDSLEAENDPDQVPRPVVAFGLALETPGLELGPHRHRKAQLLLTLRGVLTCEVESGLWLVPPNCAIWIPGGALHAIKASGTVEGYNAFIESAADIGLPASCCTVAVAPLLREVLIRAASLPVDYPEGGRESRLVTLLLDELAAAPVERLHLPMPANERLRRIIDMMIADPADRGTMASWARRAGLSERSLARILTRETGMSFGRWRQQLAILLALQWMAKGASVQQVALDLGYESAGSFVTMFRKALGTTPGRYMSALRRTAEPGDDPSHV